MHVQSETSNYKMSYAFSISTCIKYNMLIAAELMVDKAMELRYIGGVYGGNVKPSPFLCLLLKMLQIQPDKDIVIEFIKNEDFKLVFSHISLVCILYI